MEHGQDRMLVLCRQARTIRDPFSMLGLGDVERGGHRWKCEDVDVGVREVVKMVFTAAYMESLLYFRA